MTAETWRDGAAAVAALTFDVDAETPVLALGRSFANNRMTMSHQAFGPDVGVPRILDLLDDLAVPATFFVPGWVAERRPHLAPSILDRGHEVAHHSYSHRSPTSLTPAEERADFERALDVLRGQGVQVRGHRAAGWNATALTAELVGEHGLDYDSSLMARDVPYLVSTAHDDVVELPVHWSLDDWEQYAFLPAPDIGSIIQSPLVVADAWRAELDGARRYGALFNLCIHPFLSGRSGRLNALRGLIEYALDQGDVRFDRCDRIAARARLDPGLETVDPLDLDLDPMVYPID